MQNLNDYALDYFLRGNGGELARLQAQQELFRRGQESAEKSEEDVVAELRRRGYVVFKPRNRGRRQQP